MRRELTRMLREELGFNVWWAEDYSYLWQSDSHRILRACLDGVENCDIFIGLYGQRYGTSSLGLSYSELELHHAVRSRKCCLLYRLPHEDNSPRIDHRQMFLLAMLADAEMTSVPVQKVYSRADLVSRVRSDVKKLTICSSFDTQLNRTIQDWSGGSSGAVSGALAIDSTSDLIANLRRTAEKVGINTKTYANEAAKTLFGIAMLTDPRSEVSLTMLNEGIRLAYPALVWGGGGLFSQVRLTKTLMQLDQRLHCGRNLRNLGVQLASGYYAERSFRNCEKWLRIATQFSPAPGILGPLLLLQGKHDEAERQFQDLLKMINTDVDLYAIYLAYLGTSKFFRGKIKQGIALIESAEHIANQVTARVRVQRAKASALGELGRGSEAVIVIDEALKQANDYSLDDQVAKLNSLRQSILKIGIKNLSLRGQS